MYECLRSVFLPFIIKLYRYFQQTSCLLDVWDYYWSFSQLPLEVLRCNSKFLWEIRWNINEIQMLLGPAGSRAPDCLINCIITVYKPSQTVYWQAHVVILVLANSHSGLPSQLFPSQSPSEQLVEVQTTSDGKCIQKDFFFPFWNTPVRAEPILYWTM